MSSISKSSLEILQQRVRWQQPISICFLDPFFLTSCLLKDVAGSSDISSRFLGLIGISMLDSPSESLFDLLKVIAVSWWNLEYAICSLLPSTPSRCDQTTSKWKQVAGWLKCRCRNFFNRVHFSYNAKSRWKLERSIKVLKLESPSFSKVDVTRMTHQFQLSTQDVLQT